MAMMINRPDSAFYIPKRKAKKDASFLHFIHELPCIITHRPGVEACHLSFANPRYGHWGRGKSSKAGDRWCLPMSAEDHRRQHEMNEEAFWREAGIDPHLACVIIFGLFCEAGEDAVDDCRRIIINGDFRYE